MKVESYYYSKVLKGLEMCIKYVNEDDVEYIKIILDKYKLKLDSINSEIYEVSNPTNKELGTIKGGLSNRVQCFYKKGIVDRFGFLYDEYHDDYYNKKKELAFELYDDLLCKASEIIKNELSTHEIKKENIDAKILLKRKVGKWYNRTPIQNEASVYILNLMQDDFDKEKGEKLTIEIDKLETQFKNKYYETSKQ